MKLTISEKVEVRKTLFQKENESIDDFFGRCCDAQYVVSDNEKDVSFEREVLLHFLFGLVSRIREKVLIANCSNSEDYIVEAKKVFSEVKFEPNDCDIADVKVEAEENLDIFSPNHEVNEEFIEDDYYESDIKFEEDAEYESHNDDMPFEDNSVTKKKPKHSCDFCSDGFPTKIKLKKHVESQHFPPQEKDKEKDSPISELKCEHCPAEFDTVELRKEHEDKIHGQISKNCGYCQKEFTTFHLLATHLCNVHCLPNDSGKFVCVICNKVTRKVRRQVRHHILQVHLQIPNSICKICKRTFITPSHLKEHMAVAHTLERAFQCDKCEKTFKSKPTLRNHFIFHHGEKTIVKCKFESCERTFSNKIQMNTHFNYFHAKEAFVCDSCGKAFKAKDSLRYHTIKNHLSKEEREKNMHKCTEPGCVFANPSLKRVEKHIKQIHLKIKDYKCPHCPDAFGNKYRLDEHVAGIHLGLKRHKCELCDFRTAYLSVIRDHMKIVHGNQRFDCPYDGCNHSAHYKGNLTKHIRNVHKKDQ